MCIFYAVNQAGNEIFKQFTNFILMLFTLCTVHSNIMSCKRQAILYDYMSGWSITNAYSQWLLTICFFSKM